VRSQVASKDEEDPKMSLTTSSTEWGRAEDQTTTSIGERPDIVGSLEARER
jgi:hypothetical protein